MKKTNPVLFLLLICLLSQNLSAQNEAWKKAATEKKQDRLAWWLNDRFGMFIHWGLYSLPARHEWIQNMESIAPDVYEEKYFNLFNPDLYSPDEWTKMAKKAGMKYVVITTKHHEGFSLWDTKFSDFNAAKTPYKKDILKMFVDACRKEGLKIGFYFSLIDWHDKNFTIDGIHPLRNNVAAKEDNKNRDMGKYRTFVKNQVRELLTNYGKIDLLFWDFSYPGKDGKGKDEWDSEGLAKLARGLQPDIIMNDRLDLIEEKWGWDYKTPEQFMPNSWPEHNGEKVPWETCQTFSGSWGYHRDENTWKSTNQLIAMLIETVSKGGNLLLNVGPTARGNFDYRAIERLQQIGDWMTFNSKSIYGCTAAPEKFQSPKNTFLTYNKETNRLYIHLLQYPFKTLYLPGFKGQVKYAQFLHDNSEIKYRESAAAKASEHMAITAGADDLIMDLPVIKPNTEIPVIELILK